MLYINLPDNKLQQVLFLRKILDGMAALRFLMKFDFANFKAIFEAHLSYYKQKKTLKESRNKVKQLGEKEILTILNKSLVCQFYLKGRKTFESLNQ